MSDGRLQAGLADVTRRQLIALADGLQDTLGSALRGALLHGSAAMSGFEAARSDLDVLVIVDGRLTARQRTALATALLRLSATPHPVELSVVTTAALAAWRHPCPYEFHFGEGQRLRIARGEVAPQSVGDPDLAAHVTVARARGVDLLGRYDPVGLPVVPRTDFLAALLADFAWARTMPGDRDAYRHANACRTWAYLCTGQVLSKTEGIQWCRAQRIDRTDIVERVEARLRRELGALGNT
jgi:streptomycin 3"-adenylyltransferase